jgi:hypothetical protein
MKELLISRGLLFIVPLSPKENTKRENRKEKKRLRESIVNFAIGFLKWCVA